MPVHARLPDARICAWTRPPSRPARSRPRSRASVKRYRPELDVYLLTDRAVEQLAGSAEVAPIRRMFHDVEELMEIHLSILDGVSDRYDTPYFSNLKKYAQRPIGTFHALPDRARQVGLPLELDPRHGPVLRHQPVPRRIVGDDGRPRQPARADRQHQEGAGAAPRAPSAPSGPTSPPTAPRPRTRSWCRRSAGPATSCIVDRNCHKSHHYGFVLAGRPAVLRRGVPADRSTRCTAPCRCAPSRRRCSPARPKASSTGCGRWTSPTARSTATCTTPARVMEECLAIKPDLIFLWDEAWFGFARFNAVPPPAHRPWARRPR